MAGIEPNEDAEVAEGRVTGRHKAVRYAVPVGVAGAAALTIGLVPAFAGSDGPDLPKLTAEQLIARIAESDTQTVSGTVKIDTDLGLPALASGAGMGGAGMGGSRGGHAGADPKAKLTELATGSHTLRVAADGPRKQRLSVICDASEYTFIHNGDETWAYDSRSNTAFHSRTPHRGDAKRLPRHLPSERAMPRTLPKGLEDATPRELAHHALEATGKSTSVKVDGTAEVAGRDAYQLLIEPKQAGSTIGSIRIAVDAEKGVPLKFTLMPKSGGKAVVEAGFTSVDFAKPDADKFAFTPPKGAQVTERKAIERKVA